MLHDFVTPLHDLFTYNCYILLTSEAGMRSLFHEVTYIYIHHPSCPYLQLHYQRLGVYEEGDDAMYVEEDNYGVHHLQS
jgi:hypothetical protein